LSVFAGGWTLEAAEAVGPGDGIDVADVLDLQAQLVDKSLVSMDADGERYHMLETVREYARARLDAADASIPSGAVRDSAAPEAQTTSEGRATRDRHLAHCFTLVEDVRAKLAGPGRAQCLARLDRERENFLAAHAWCGEAPHPDAGMQLCHALGHYFFARGLPAVGYRLTLESIDRPGAQVRIASRASALCEAGQIDCFMGNYARANGLLRESLDIARALQDRTRIASVLQPLAMSAFGQGDLDAARGYLEEACELARELGDRRELAAAMNGLAQVHRSQGELDRAETLYGEVVAISRGLGDRESIAIGLLNLAMVSLARGSADLAHGMLLEIVDIAIAIDSQPVGLSAIDVAAALAARRGQWDDAARFWGAAQAQVDETGFHRDPTDEAFVTPYVEAARTALGGSAFLDAERGGRALSPPQALEEARAWLRRAC
jgi:non-specific serine/threonine protein kinase